MMIKQADIRCDKECERESSTDSIELLSTSPPSSGPAASPAKNHLFSPEEEVGKRRKRVPSVECSQVHSKKTLKKPVPAPLPLSDQQQLVLDFVVNEKRNVFVTGGAGTGKSFLLRSIISALPLGTTFVTATTGIAALQLGGTTLHSFAGCGIVEPGAAKKAVLKRLKYRSIQKWMKCEVLIIDEVSMLEREFFETLEYIARHIRNSNQPFGGIQLVLSGDFLQLPPVSPSSISAQARDNRFCFQSRAWLLANPKVCVLTKPFRQKNIEFFKMLHEIRRGCLSTSTVARIYGMSSSSSLRFIDPSSVPDSSPARNEGGVVKKELTPASPGPFRSSDGRPSVLLTDSRGRPKPSVPGDYTFLRPRRAEVEKENQRFYAALDGPEYGYVGFHEGRGLFPSDLPRVLRLRKGCRVMLNKNLDVPAGLVNGTSGTVTGFYDCSLAAPGSGIDHLSLVRRVCEGSLQERIKPHTFLPIVTIMMHHPGEPTVSRQLIVEPAEWTEIEGDEQVSRTVQLPLVIAFSITIHKCQGMSLTWVDIDLSRSFEAGQAYVALSRCTDLEGVRINGFHPGVVMTSATAVAYYAAVDLWERRDRLHRLKEAVDFVGSEDDRGAVVAVPLPPCGYDTSRLLIDDHDESVSERAWDSFDRVLWESYRSTESREGFGPSMLSPSATTTLRVAPNAAPAGTDASRIECLRRRIHHLQGLSMRLKHFVKFQSVSVLTVRDALLVLDVDACLYLFSNTFSSSLSKGEVKRESSRLPGVHQGHFSAHGLGNGNMLRVPRVVWEAIESKSEANETAEESSRETSLAWSEGVHRKLSANEGVALFRRIRETLLALQERLELDIQRTPEEQADSSPLLDQTKDPLTNIPDAWLPFLRLLPLFSSLAAGVEELQHEMMRSHTSTVEEPSLNMLEEEKKSGEAMDLLFATESLHFHPDETTEQHRQILSYTMFLQETFGADTPVYLCTRSELLAATAMILKISVASFPLGDE